jgi:glycosyltransferase involved in cell wall biosynthesis
MRSILKGLASRGWAVSSLTSTIYDSPNGWKGLHSALAPNPGLSFGPSTPIPTVTIRQDGGIHSVLQTANWRRSVLSAIEETRFVALFRRWLEQTKPSIIISYGGMLLEAEIRRRSKSMGVASVFYLVNGSYTMRETFDDVDLAITDTASTADLYRMRFGLELFPLGKFIDREKVVAPTRIDDYVTFINPTYTKGAGLFCAIAKLARERLPNLRFLVVESRSTWQEALAGLNLKPADLPNVHFTPHTTDIRQIYARTSVLLLPSLWHESGARVIAEAQLNGIPVLATDRGGNAEMVAKGGRIFDAPARLVAENRQLATDAEAEPWVSCLSELLPDTARFDDLRRATLAAGQRFDMSTAVDRLEHAFENLAR